jgi:hypothetical protein
MLQVSPVREVYFSVRGVNNCKLIVKVILNSESIVGILGQNSGFSSGLSYKYVCAANKTKGNNKEKSVAPLCAGSMLCTFAPKTTGLTLETRDLLCGFDHILNICGRFCVGFTSHTKWPMSPVLLPKAQKSRATFRALLHNKKLLIKLLLLF